MTSHTPRDRRARLAAELRANLKRRKAQARLRQPQEKLLPILESPVSSPQDTKKDAK